MKIRIRHIALIFTLLLLGGMTNEAWAAKVIYHILTLPIDNDIYHLAGVFSGNRLEAVRVVDNNATTVDLPAAFKSPLVTPGSFKYYASTDVTKSATAVAMYDYNSNNKSYYYSVNGGATDIAGNPVSSDIEVYVTYEYNADNTIYKLDGSKVYNLSMSGGYLALNRGRNNRIAVIPESSNRVSAEDLASDDFVKVNVSGISGTNISSYWNGNPNPRSEVEGQFFFKFKFMGSDPYNILICTAYDKDYTYIEKHGSETQTYYKYYKNSYLYWPASDKSGFFLSSDDHTKYTQVSTGYDPNPKASVTSEVMTGYFKSKGADLTYNSFALLNNTGSNGYVFMISRYIDKNGDISTPGDYKTASYRFLTHDANWNNLISESKTLAYVSENYSADEETYIVNSYRFKVKTPFGNVISVDMKWSEAHGTDLLTEHVPDALKRKYVTFTGAYKTEALDDIANNELTSFADADVNATRDGDKRVIWLKYETTQAWSNLFETLPVDKDFTDARWYTMRMNAQNQYVVHLNDAGTEFHTGGGSDSNLHQGENSLEAQVAFVGDPFELRIISHKASHNATPSAGNRYIGCTSSAVEGTTFSAVTSSDICSWEIIADETSGSFKLRQYGTYADPWYFGWNYGASNNPIIYTKGSASSIKVVEMEKKRYYYHIYNTAGNIAVMASVKQDVGVQLKYDSIPEIIRSPLIQPGLATIQYYSDAACQNEIIHAPFNATADANKDIYVKYTITGAMPTGNYRVRLNIDYIYYNSGNISSSAEYVTSEDAANNYIWHLDITDPYAMIINNTGITGESKFVKVNSWANKAALGWDVLSSASKFIVKSNGGGNYEVMAPTGDGVDASTTYYNIGRTDADGVKMFSNDESDGGYPHTYPQIRFALASTAASAVDFHLIDKDNKELLVVRRSTTELSFPDQYRSPLVSTYHYWTSRACDETLGSIGTAPVVDGVKQVYVTYDTNNLINLRKGQLYLLKFAHGDTFRQENGSDDLIDPPGKQAVYPYCNGDCNFFVYGQDEYELQQHGAASTRTRWAWYVESANNDPYHVKICSRQLESFNNNDHQAYFYTSVQHFKYPTEDEASDHVVTSLAWPGITGVQGTEYMVLGTVTDQTRNFQLVTTPVDNNGDNDCLDEGEHPFYVVNSFEQYWKTYDTIKNKLLKNILEDDDKGANPEGATKVPTVPPSYRELLTGTGSGQYGFHSYDYYAYAKRFNGYNKDGATSKGWEKIEHWYQTVNMGEGYFDFKIANISPVMILLDQHGWEIMRKPLPYSDQDPDKETKKNILKTYDSPMVKEYIFWASAKKRTGLHQYYLLDKRIGGKTYTAKSLYELPPWGSENVLDAKGNQNDEYVTYIVKDEYAQSYDPSTQTGSEFLIQQGDKFAYTNTTEGVTTIKTKAVNATGGLALDIINVNTRAESPGYAKDSLWYLKPNANIDDEQGYKWVSHSWDAKTPNAYEHFSNLKTADYIENTEEYKNAASDTERKAITDKYGWFTFSNGFDPYNIQISSARYTDKYFVTNAKGATLQEGEGSVIGVYDDTPELSLGTPRIDDGTSGTWSWYDSRRLAVTNATFMAVEDADKNMQLMPRFDQTRRVRDFSQIVTPTAEADDPQKLPETYTKVYRPMVYNYHIIDNQGRESLRYRGGGDLVPQTPDHFKSPLAKDFKYYKGLTATAGVYDLTGLNSKLINESFAGANLTGPTNDVYVRYEFDEEADVDNIMKGKWFTMQLNAKDAKYDSGIKEGADKPETINREAKTWQWKFLKTPQTDPDPYAIQLFNRHNPEATPGADNSLPSAGNRFAILEHTSGGYALAQAGLGDYTYNFLNGDGGMNTTTAAGISSETGFKSTSCSFTGTNSQVVLLDDVKNAFEYRVYTRAGDFAISAVEELIEGEEYDYTPELPDAAKTPLMDIENFRYYDTYPFKTENGKVVPDTIGKDLKHTYGLYDDIVYVHYMPYDANKSEYKVPNVRNATGSTVAKGEGSNDAGLGLNADQLYNIIWYVDNMMTSNGSTISSEANQPLQGGESYVWTFEGGDPYAIKIKHRTSGKYAVGASDLSATPTKTFMLLNKDGYDYGVLQVTGDNTNKQKLTGDGNSLTVDAATDPNHFIFFALATYKVIYHLVIANTYYDDDVTHAANEIETIPFWDGSQVVDFDIKGTTQRDLSVTYQLGETINGQNYSHDAGQISLGDKLEVPSVFYRPNVVYRFFVEGVYNHTDCSRAIEYGTEGSHIDVLDGTFRGKELTEMGREPGLLDKVVRINIVYSFNGDLETNAGSDFVRSVAQNKWYTFEAKKNDGTPQLMQFTNAWGMEVKEGRGTHYTNDYLWTPLGDPYGFKMYHRYTCVNSGDNNTGEPDRVMTTAGFSDNQEVWMSDGTGSGANKIANPAASTNSVYELLEGNDPGYFKIHPVANKEGTQYNLKIERLHEGNDESNPLHDYVVLSSSSYTPFTFGLSDELMKPYYDRAGYIGGLTTTPNPGNEKSGKQLYEEAGDDLMAKQTVVYNPDNIVHYQPGYYRLHSPEDIEVDGLKINPVRYASGYTHQVELSNALDGGRPVPMHFYEVEGNSSQFNQLKSKDGSAYDVGYTISYATRGDIPIPAVEYDPASIFYFSQVPEDLSIFAQLAEGSASAYHDNANMAIMSTQGLYVKCTKEPGATEPLVSDTAKAVMTTAMRDATPLYIMDIGGGILLIHDQQTAGGRANLKYLSYDQEEPTEIYNLKLTHRTHTDHAKWLMQPANHLGLRVTTHSGGDGGTYGGTTYNYTTFYAPFDVMLPDTVKNGDDITKIYHAALLDSKNSPWDPPRDLHPKSMGRYNIEANGCPSKLVDGKELFRTNDRFIPAGTPVLIAMHDNAGYVILTLPNSTPHPMNSPFTANTKRRPEDTNKDNLGERTNILTGQYLEQELSDMTSDERIFVFGLPYSGTMTPDWSTGEINATLPLQDNSGMGFYLNANPNKEKGFSIGDWTRNNWYVYSNKVYYRYTPALPSPTRGDIQFVPVVFDDEEGEVEENGVKEMPVGDGCVYDLLGRKVATKQQVEDGTWRQNLRPGIYILNGRKIRL